MAYSIKSGRKLNHDHVSQDSLDLSSISSVISEHMPVEGESDDEDYRPPVPPSIDLAEHTSAFTLDSVSNMPPPRGVSEKEYRDVVGDESMLYDDDVSLDLSRPLGEARRRKLRAAFERNKNVNADNSSVDGSDQSLKDESRQTGSKSMLSSLTITTSPGRQRKHMALPDFNSQGPMAAFRTVTDKIKKLEQEKGESDRLVQELQQKLRKYEEKLSEITAEKSDSSRTSATGYTPRNFEKGEGSRQDKGKRKEGWENWDRKSRRDESSDDSEENKESGIYIDPEQVNIIEEEIADNRRKRSSTGTDRREVEYQFITFSIYPSLPKCTHWLIDCRPPLFRNTTKLLFCLYDENYLHYSRVDDRYDYGYESDPREYYIHPYDAYDHGYGSYYYRPSPISVVHEMPKWNDVKNSKSYLRRRGYTGSDIKREKARKKSPGDRRRESSFPPGTSTGKSPSVTAKTQRALSLMKEHNSKTCSICKIGKDENNNKSTHARTNSYYSKGDEDEVSPDMALEKVIDNLRDELSHLHMVYNQLSYESDTIDPVNSRNKWHSIKEQINEVLHSMDLKSDQIETLQSLLPSSAGKSRPSPSSEDKSFYSRRSLRGRLARRPRE
ncbi:10511_t:CDS:2 [Paraglomus occultum]|uniref:10511_t:CDS:1 n=1 Tax=Paraglomus occultum TaxID=144539 RepID=A0A9N8W7H7_9GLOM|nr:10511_t:CDS:2 [Paraglomus occultum]